MGEIVRFKTRQGPKRLRPGPALRQPATRKGWWPLIIGGVLVVSLIGLEVGFPLAGCQVKGNISPRTGERIYHLPGQSYYVETRVNWFVGERWFCSEEAAQRAGWRRATS